MDQAVNDRLRNLLAETVQQACRCGAHAADALLVQGQSIGVAWHAGQVESLDHSEGGDLGLRVFVDKKQAIVSTTDFGPETVRGMIERAVSMAKAASEDPFCGLAPSELIAQDSLPLDLSDSYDVDPAVFIARAREAEEAALDVNGVVQCESSHAGGSQSHVFLAASNGFSGDYGRTSYWISSSPVAGDGTAMVQDYEYDTCTFQSDLLSASKIGRMAAERTVAGLGARKMPSCQVPIVFDPREARSLLGTFAGAISGSGVARGTSFLKDFLGKQVFSKDITIIDDPFRVRGARSKPFDAEGIMPARRAIVTDGMLETWFLDLRSARQLGMKSTGHASRGISSVPRPSPTNLFMEAGPVSPAELMSDIKQGFYVTEMMGDGINDVTGDFSQAARGFWIENGKIAHSVSEMTVAGNLKDMFLNASPASDLQLKYGIDSPTLRIEGMTVAGV